VTCLATPSILLVEPQMGENIGAVARMMANLGLRDLRLIRPRDGWPNPRAYDVAVGAFEHLDPVQLFDDFADSCHSLHQLYASSARKRDMEKHVISPQELCLHIDHAQQSNPLLQYGLVIGPERSGLSNTILSQCHFIVSIPVNPQFASINMAHAATILCSQLALYQPSSPHHPMMDTNVKSNNISDHYTTSHRDLLYLLHHLERQLQAHDFFKCPDKQPGMMVNIRNLFTKIPLSAQEIRTLHGIIRLLDKPPSH
jgi:tRNA/rRNA methyltransferase